jgi:hypothetical protein
MQQTPPNAWDYPDIGRGIARLNVKERCVIGPALIEMDVAARMLIASKIA